MDWGKTGKVGGPPLSCTRRISAAEEEIIGGHRNKGDSAAETLRVQPRPRANPPRVGLAPENGIHLL